MTKREEAALHSPESRRILIYGINYWPEVTGIAPYTAGLARHLATHDHHVTVVSGMPHYPEWRVAPGYGGWSRREMVGGVDLRRLAHYVPPRQSAVGRALYEATFLARGAMAMRVPRPDLVVGVVPSLSGGALAAIAARRFRVPFGLIIQDLMGPAAAQSGIPGGRRVATLTREIEKRILRTAAQIAIVSEGFRPYLETLGIDRGQIFHVPNWSHVKPATRSRAQMRAELGWDDGVQIVLHAGNMGLKQGLEHVVAAAHLAAQVQPQTRFVLMGDGSQRGMLQSLATGCPNITFLPPQEADRFVDTLAAADVLLVNERSSVVDMSLPSKLTSYFVAGRPVVAAGASAGATAREVRCAGAGLTVPGEDPEALLAALVRLAGDPLLGERLGAAGASYARNSLSPEAALARAEDFVLGLEGELGRRPAGHGTRQVPA